MKQIKIVFLASDCESSRWVYNALKTDFNLEAAIIERPVSKTTLIKGRLKKIGFFKVMGQVMFSVLAVPLLKMSSANRKAALLKKYHLNSSSQYNGKTYRIHSVNDDTCIQLLHQLLPDIIIVNGTRIISKKILHSTNAVFINMHAGITPQYRGSHGGYWALRNNDAENFGTTIHLIDAGVDTGAVIKQVFTKPEKQDNFTTYPILQVAIGIAALQETLTAMISGNYNTTVHSEKGNLYYQPTFWEYLTGNTR